MNTARCITMALALCFSNAVVAAEQEKTATRSNSAILKELGLVITYTQSPPIRVVVTYREQISFIPNEFGLGLNSYSIDQLPPSEREKRVHLIEELHKAWNLYLMINSGD